MEIVIFQSVNQYFVLHVAPTDESMQKLPVQEVDIDSNKSCV